MPSYIADLAVSRPDKGRSTLVRTLYNHRLEASLSKLLQIAGNGLGRDFSEVLSQVENLRLESALHPAWYDAHHRLKEAMKAQNTGQAEAIIKYIRDEVSSLPYPSCGEIRISTIDSAPWQSEVLSGFRQENFGIQHAGELAPIGPSLLGKHGQYALQAIQTIRQCAPAMSEELDQLVNGLCLFGGVKAERGMVGGSDVRVFGEIYLRINDFDDHHVVYYAEHLVHECSHLYLHALMALDPLILNDRSERYPAPIRPDLRPMYGIYHATFVLSRMVWVFAAIAKEIKSPEFEIALNLFRKQFLKGQSVVLDHGKMTEAGRAIVDSYAPFLEDCL